MEDPDKYIPPLKVDQGVLMQAPAALFPDLFVRVHINEQSIRDMPMDELCDAMKAYFYSEPGGTDTKRCAKILAAIHDAFKHSAY